MAIRAIIWLRLTANDDFEPRLCENSFFMEFARTISQCRGKKKTLS